MDFDVVPLSGQEERRAWLANELVVAGWAGRDAEAIEHHIRELEAIGVKRPRATPLFYRVSASLLTTSSRVQAAGGDSSGEAEAVLVHLEDGLYVGIGSDHTDRKVEAYGVTVSKQMCAKPVGPKLWRYEDVAAHWDQLEMVSYATVNGERRLYQKGTLAGLRDPQDLLSRYRATGGAFGVGAAMFCGTLAIQGEIQYAPTLELELSDPVLGRTLRHTYHVDVLTIAD